MEVRKGNIIENSAKGFHTQRLSLSGQTICKVGEQSLGVPFRDQGALGRVSVRTS